VNHAPSFAVDANIDHEIKYNLIKDTFSLLNLNIQERWRKINRINEKRQEHFNGFKKQNTIKETIMK
jgi:hypothetical protein